MRGPTERTLRWLRGQGYTCEVVEYWLKLPGMAHGRRKDMLGVIDILALRPGSTALGVQSTVFGERKRRLAKILAEPKARLWVMGGQQIWVVSWRPKGHNEPDVIPVSLGDFGEKMTGGATPQNKGRRK